MASPQWTPVAPPADPPALTAEQRRSLAWRRRLDDLAERIIATSPTAQAAIAARRAREEETDAAK